MPVVLVLLLIAHPFHSQKCPSLDGKLYSHYSRYGRHPEIKCVGYFLSHNPEHMHTVALSLIIFPFSLWKSAHWPVLSVKTALSLPLGCMAKPHQLSQGDVHTPRCLVRQVLHRRACLHSFPVLPCYYFQHNVQFNLNENMATCPNILDRNRDHTHWV